VLACQDNPRGMIVTITHSGNGLRLSLPEALPLDGVETRPMVTEIADGFKVELGAETQRRVKIEASVALGAAEEPAGAWPSERYINGRRIHFRIDRAEGGSGGAHIDLHAWERCTNGRLEYAQHDVVEEPGEPDFSLVWRVIAHTRSPR
jgi:hypothetical protein